MPIADFRLSDGSIASIEVPEGTTPEQATLMMQAHFAAGTQPPAEEIGLGEEFTHGFQRGLEGTKSLITEGVPGLAKSLANRVQEKFGFEPSFDPMKNLEQYQKEVQESLKQHPTQYASLSDIDSLKGAAHFAASAAGETLPSLISSLAGGGAGALIAKQGLKNLAKRGGKELLESEINKAIIKGTMLGTTAAGAPQNVAETYMNLLQGGQDAPMTALVTGGLKTALDNYTPETILGKVFGTKEASELVGKSLMKKIGIEGVKAAGFEGLTEASQEALDVLAEQIVGTQNGELFSKENILRLADAGLKGAIGGGIAGAASAPLIRTPEEGQEFKPSEKSKEFFETEVVAEDPTDSTILSPAYIDTQTKETSKNLGLETESLTQLGTKDIAKVTKTLSNEPIEITELPKIEAPVLEQVKKRQKKAKEVKPKSVDIKVEPIEEQHDFTQFIPGDGMIHEGVKVNEASTLRTPETLVKVDDANKLEQLTKPKEIRLPSNLRSAKPRYKMSELNFASDLEKALYIASSKQVSKKKNEYTNWLKEQGLDDQKIASLGQEVRNTIKEQHIKQKEPKVLNVPTSSTQPKTQKAKGFRIPYYGNVHQDFVVPSVIAENINAMKLTSKAEAIYQDMMNLAKRVVKEVAGPNLEVKFYDTLSQGPDFRTAHPIRGVQFHNIIGIALRHNSDPERVTETAYHEAIHAIYQHSFTQGEKQILLDNTDRLIDYAMKDSHLRTLNLTDFLLTQEGKEELIVNSLAKMMVEYKQNPKNLEQLPSMFKRAFLRILNYLKKLANGLRGLGFTTEEDIFESIAEGKRIKDLTSDALNTLAQARYQRLVDATQEAHNQAREQTYNEYIAEQRHLSNLKVQSTQKGMGYYGARLRSITDLASRDNFASVVYDSVRRKLANTSNLLKSYVSLQKNFGSQSKDVRYRIYSLADEMRATKQRATLDEEGNLVFKRGNQTLRLKNKEVSKAYVDLQAAYAKVITDWREELLRSGSKTFKHLLPEGVDVTLEDLRKALATLDKSKTPDTYTKLNNLVEALDAVDSFTKYDFIPRMRFGQNGIAVKNKDDETVAFYTIEKGSFRNIYDEYQLKEAIKEIKEKYDSPEYKVKDANGTVKNLDNIVPFTMTNNIIKGHINPRFLNMESLASLLFSKDMDQKAYADMRNEIYKDILEKGFEKRFSESKNIEGYSKDWDRVHHAYLSGAAHFLAGLPHQEEISALLIENTRLADPVLKKKLADYMEYVNSPQEDWQTMRTINFMWTMGGNLSTALMQVMTLPTTTLGVMTQYNPNIIQNMRYIGKWTKLAMPFIKEATKRIEWKDGSFSVDFADKDILDRLEKSGEIDKETRNFIEKVNQYGLWAGLLTEESVGYKPFETRSLGGGVKEKLSNTGRLLGIPTNAMEQMTRFATTMASFEMLKNNPQARERMERILKEDYRFQAQLRNQKDMSFTENAALFNMDEAHAVFGKLGRVDYQRGVGGALFFPFMTYPHQMLELLARMYGRGPEGKRALAMTLSAMFLLGGLMGLPGAELLKELMEALQKQLTGVEHDYDLLFREAIYDVTGSPKFAKMITQGIGRGYLGLDVSKRIGLPIPGQELLMNILSIKGDSSGILGVSGSILGGITQAWNEYNQGGGTINVLQSIVPVAASNILKAYSYTDIGPRTRAGLQIVRPEDISAQSVIARALGITSDQIATGREALFYTQLEERKYAGGIEKYKKQAQNIMTEIMKAQKNQDFDKAKDLRQDYQEVMQEFKDFLKEHNIKQNMQSFNKSIKTRAKQRTAEKVNFKDIKKGSRKDVKVILESLGVDY
jgi:hypothetical protein